ncbi:MAG TPA: hypothetical protein VFR11_23690 [Micromonosporaceae bacterium]|nr:hypothetical protein [Micromonosporaceae bacterium]
MLEPPIDRQACYGIAEIADSLGVGRQLVAVWRRRRSHGMPEPDAELASGPVWLANTIEPWMHALPVRPTGERVAATAAEVRQLARRWLRLLVLLLEERPRLELVARALADVRELLDLAMVSADGRDGGQAAITALLGPLRHVKSAPNADDLTTLRGELLSVLPAFADLRLEDHVDAVATGRGDKR